MSKDAITKQIEYWSRAVKQMQKAIRRKNKYINRLERENDRLNQTTSILMTEILELMPDSGDYPPTNQPPG